MRNTSLKAVESHQVWATGRNLSGLRSEACMRLILNGFSKSALCSGSLGNNKRFNKAVGASKGEKPGGLPAATPHELDKLSPLSVVKALLHH